MAFVREEVSPLGFGLPDCLRVVNPPASVDEIATTLSQKPPESFEHPDLDSSARRIVDCIITVLKLPSVDPVVMIQSVWPGVCLWTAKLLDHYSEDRIIKDAGYHRIPGDFMDRVLVMAFHLLVWGCKKIQLLHLPVSREIEAVFLDKVVPTYFKSCVNLALYDHPIFPKMWIQLCAGYWKHLFTAWIKTESTELIFLCAQRLKNFPPPPRSHPLSDEHNANNLLFTFLFINPDIWLGDELPRFLFRFDIVGWTMDKMAREAQGELDNPFEPKFYHFLSTVFEQGFSWASQALESGLIRSMTKIPGQVRKKFGAESHGVDGRNLVEETSQQLVALINLLKSLLVYRSVLNRVLRSMASTQASNAFKRLKEVDEPVAIALDALFSTAASLKEEMHLFDQNASKWDCCSNKFCSSPKNLKLLRCSKCQWATYCSAGCQKTDWKNHRLRCAELAEMPTEGFPLRPGPLDLGFIRYLTIRNLANEGIPSEVDSNPEIMQGRAWLVAYNYTVFPPKKTVQLAPLKGQWNNYDQDFNWFDALYPSQEDRERLTQVHIRCSGVTHLVINRVVVDSEGNLVHYEIPYGGCS